MSDQNDKPLLTFAVVAYNQERFIREALAGAFAQTYSPLELILSDDCSSDQTFEIMREMATAYRGPHRIVLNRNEVRRGLGDHVNRVMELSHGELVLAAAGDDISLSERAQVIYEAWKADGKRATTVHSNFMTINEVGEPLDAPPIPRLQGLPLPLVVQNAVTWEFVRTERPLATGCANAWSPRLFSEFGPLPTNVVYEDLAITFRSVIVGRILLVDVPLVKYRTHPKNLYYRSRNVAPSIASFREEESKFQNKFQNRAIMHAGFLADLETARSKRLLSEDEYARCHSEAHRMREGFELQARYFQSGILTKTWILWRLWRMRAEAVPWPKLFHRWMPQSLLVTIKLGLIRLRGLARIIKRAIKSRANNLLRRPSLFSHL